MSIRLQDKFKFALNPQTTLYVWLCFLFFFPLPKPHHACQELDRMSLLSFSNNISTPLNWSSSSDCCNWEGIYCGGDGWVSSLSLPSKGLKGTLSPSLANLSHLSYLNLSHNSLSGPLPPSFISSFNHLQILDLSFNCLFGELSASASPNQTSFLEFLNLSSNHFLGNFQLSFLGQASNLVALDISNNSFTGLISSSICESSTMLELLDFSLNEFSNEIPSGLGGCSQLEVFKAGGNQLTGPLPNDIYDVLSLQKLSVPCNSITGYIDRAYQIVRLVNLIVLDLSRNNLTGQLPQDIGKLTNLEQLILYENNFSGPLPPSLTNCINLQVLSLCVNQLEGNLSAFDFSKLIHLNTLDLGVNKFSGNLPVSLYSSTSLTAIRLTNNQLEGQIQPQILALNNLSYLAISTNRLTNISGAFQILRRSRSLTTLILNFDGEAIPENIDSDGFQNLRLMGIGGCLLTGQVPTWLLNLKRLEVLDLSENQLTGSIPGWLGTLPRLFYIDLSDNFLTGELPLELTELPTLASSAPVDQFSLELPVYVVFDNDNGHIYNQLSSLPPAIYLGDNGINGSIPPDIGLLKNLHILDLSLNKFTGEISDRLSNLRNLEMLDLSGNSLTGGIPSSLTQMHFLSWFSVAYNNLKGTIPVGGQFDTFSNSSYVGNPMLCGPTLRQPCQIQGGKTTTGLVSAPGKSIDIRQLLVVLGIWFGCGSLFTVLTIWIISKKIKVRREDGNKINVELGSFSSNLGVAPIWWRILLLNKFQGTCIGHYHLLMSQEQFCAS